MSKEENVTEQETDWRDYVLDFLGTPEAQVFINAKTQRDIQDAWAAIHAAWSKRYGQRMRSCSELRERLIADFGVEPQDAGYMTAGEIVAKLKTADQFNVAGKLRALGCKEEQDGRTFSLPDGVEPPPEFREGGSAQEPLLTANFLGASHGWKSASSRCWKLFKQELLTLRLWIDGEYAYLDKDVQAAPAPGARSR